MKYIPILLALTLPAAAAHEVVSYGTVSAEFHTDANEHLRAGDDTLVGFRLLVEGKEISAQACKCQLLLYKGKPSARVMPQIIEVEAGFDNPNAAEGWARVNDAGAYTLVLAGKPREAGAFDPFRLEYPLNAYADVFAVPPPTTSQPAEAENKADMNHADTHKERARE